MQQLQEAHFQVVAERFAVKMRAHCFGFLWVSRGGGVKRGSGKALRCSRGTGLSVIPFRVPRLPVVGVAADVLQGPFRFPVQFAVRLGGVGVTYCRIARAAGRDLVGYRYAVRLFVGADQFQNRMARAGTEVVDVHSGFHVFISGGVPFGEVGNVNVVAHPRAVGRGVVVSEDVKFRPSADRHLGDVGHQVVRDPARVFPDLAARVGTDGIEVAQKRYRKAGVRGGEIGQDLLVHQLGPAVGVDAAGRLGLLQRHVLARSVDGRAGAEDQFVHAELRHHLAEGECRVQVVVVVFERLLDRFADRLVSGEVDHRVDLVFGEDLFELFAVADVGDVEDRFAPGEAVDTADRFGAAVREVVDDDDAAALTQEGQGGVGADVSGAAGQKEGFGHLRGGLFFTGLPISW